MNCNKDIVQSNVHCSSQLIAMYKILLIIAVFACAKVDKALLKHPNAQKLFLGKVGSGGCRTSGRNWKHPPRNNQKEH